MQINRQLLNQLLNRMEKECEELIQEVSCYVPSSLPYLNHLQKKQRQIHLLRLAVFELSSDSNVQAMKDFHDSFRWLRLNLRVTRRRWRRFLSGTVSFQGIQERRTRAATSVA